MLLITSCSYIEYNGQWPPSDYTSNENAFNEQIYIPSNALSFTTGEQVTAVYTNHTSSIVYVVHPNSGGDNPLQKRTDDGWKTINTKPEGIGYTQVIRYGAIKPGGTRKFVFPEARLREMGKEVAGTYRFSFTITPNRQYGDNTIIYSRAFTISENLD